MYLAQVLIFYLFYFLTIATHGPCWGLHTERHAPPFLTLFDVFAFSRSLSLSLSQLLINVPAWVVCMSWCNLIWGFRGSAPRWSSVAAGAPAIRA